jgi:hypothetical protein
VDDEIRAWNSTPLPGVRSFRNLPSGTRKSALRRLGSDSPDSLVLFFLFGCSTCKHPFLAAQPLAPFISQKHFYTDLTNNPRLFNRKKT